MVLLFSGVAFVVGWLFFGALVSIVGGWFWLARAYPCPRDRRSDTNIVFGSVSLNWVCSYRRCITVGVDAEGLFLRPILFFRFMHPAIFVPWSEMAVAQTGRLLWTSVFEFVPPSGGPVVQLYGSAATLAKATAPMSLGTGAWRALVIQNVIALALFGLFISFIVKNTHVTNTAARPAPPRRPATAFSAPSKNALKGPLSKLAWTLGDWTCSVNGPGSATLSARKAFYVRAIPDTSGLAIDSTTSASDYTDEERTMWDTSKATFVDQAVALTTQGPVQIVSVMKSSDHSASRFTFVGKIKAATFNAMARQTTFRTGLNSLSLTTAYLLKDGWRTVETSSCIRSTSNTTTQATPAMQI